MISRSYGPHKNVRSPRKFDANFARLIVVYLYLYVLLFQLRPGLAILKEYQLFTFTSRECREM